MPRFQGIPLEPVSEEEEVRAARPRFRGLPIDEPSSFADIPQFFYGANQELNRVVGAPMELLSQTMGRGMEAAGLTSQMHPSQALDFPTGPDPQSVAGRVMRRTGQEVGATVPYAGLPYMAPPGAGGPLRSVFEGVRNAPAQAGVGELAATIGAGAAAGGAGEVAPGRVGAEMTAQLAGGVAPAALLWSPSALLVRGTATLGRRGYGAVHGAITGAATPAEHRKAAEYVADRIGPKIEEFPYATELERTEQLRREIPGFRPSLGEATQHPSLLATQRRIEAESHPDLVTKYHERYRQNREAVKAYSTGRAPREGRITVTDDLTGRIGTERGRISAKRMETELKLRELGVALPRVERTETGRALRERLNVRADEAREAFSRRANELGLDNIDATTPVTQLARNVAAAIEPKGFFADKRIPDVYRLLKEAEGSNVQVTFKDMMELRSRVADDIREEISTHKRPKVIDSLLRIEKELDKQIDEFGRSIGDPDLAQRYAQWRSDYVENYIKPFRQGDVFKVRQRGPRGEYRVRDEQVAAAFFKPDARGGVTAIQQYKRAFGPEGADAMASIILDDLARAAVVDGKLNPRRLETWRKAHAAVLNEFPEVRQAISEAADANTNLLARQSTLDARSKAVESDRLTRELDAISAGVKEEGDLILRAMKHPNLMRNLMDQLSPDGRQTLKRHVWFQAQEVGEINDSMKASIKMVLGDKHFNDLQVIFDATRIMDSLNMPIARADQPVPLESAEQLLGMGLPQFGSRVFAWKAGRMQKGYLATDVFMRFLRGRSLAETAALYEEALYDPAVAKDLADMLRARRIKPETAKRLNVRLFNLGLSARTEEEEE